MSQRNKFYRKLLWLYPKSYRQNYAEQIAQTFDDMVHGESSRRKRAWLIAKEYLTLPGNVIEQHVAEASHKGGLSNKAFAALISLILFAPFVAAFVADEISERLYHSHSFASWLWSPLAVFIWLIVLPVASLFISLTAYLLLILRKSIQRSKITLQLREAWLLIVVILFSAGLLLAVLYRDGFSCVQGTSKSSTQVFQCVVSNLKTRDTK